MNKYLVTDMDKKEMVLEFTSEDEDAAITYVFSLYNPPPVNYNLYQIIIDTDKNFNFQQNAKYIELPKEITEDGDYVFY